MPIILRQGMKRGLERLVPYIPVVNENNGERLKTINWGDWGYVATGIGYV